MPVRIKVENYPASNTKDDTQLAAPVIVGATSATVDGTPNIDTHDFVYFGRIGQQSLDPVEKRQVTIAGSVLTISALTYAHPEYSPVKAVYGDQIQLYRAAAVGNTVPDDSSFSTLGSLIDIDAGQTETEFNDDTGTTLFWYKWRYYNSYTTAFTSDLEDVEAIRGEEYGNYTTIAAIRKEALISNNPYISDASVRADRSAAQSAIDAAINNVYTVPLVAPIQPLIARATTLLAAGYILIRQGATTMGQAKIDEVLGTKDAPGIIGDLLSGKQELLDDTGTPLVDIKGVTGWPTYITSSTSTQQGGSKRAFRRGMNF